MIRSGLLACAVLASADGALALSCLRPDPVREYVLVRDAEARYRVVHGTFLPDGPPVDIATGDERGVEVEGRFSGLALGRSGFDRPFDEAVLVRALCIAEWCGAPPGDGAVLAFVELHPDGPRVTTDACGGGFYQVTADELRRVVSCHRSGRCPAADD